MIQVPKLHKARPPISAHSNWILSCLIGCFSTECSLSGYKPTLGQKSRNPNRLNVHSVSLPPLWHLVHVTTRPYIYHTWVRWAGSVTSPFTSFFLMDIFCHMCELWLPELLEAKLKQVQLPMIQHLDFTWPGWLRTFINNYSCFPLVLHLSTGCRFVLNDQSISISPLLLLLSFLGWLSKGSYKHLTTWWYQNPPPQGQTHLTVEQKSTDGLAAGCSFKHSIFSCCSTLTTLVSSIHRHAWALTIALHHVYTWKEQRDLRASDSWRSRGS